MPIGMPAKIFRQIPPEELDYSMDSNLRGLDPNQPAIDPSAPPADPYQFAVPSDYEREAYMDDVNAFLRSRDPMDIGRKAADAVRELKQGQVDPNRYEPIPGNPGYYYDKIYDRETLPSGGPGKMTRKIVQIDPTKMPENLPVSPSVSGKKTDVDVSPAQEISEQQLLRNYLQSLQKRRDDQGDLLNRNAIATENSRVALLAEGLSKAASKMGNLMGKPTGSTMEGFGKQAGAIEMGNVDQARKIMAESDPTAELARQAQIAQMMESIRASRAKTKQAEAEINRKIEEDKKPKPPPKLTEGELKAADYGKRMYNAEKDMDVVVRKNYDPSTVSAALRRIDLPIVGEYFANPLDRQYLAAAREWVAGLLRKDSGSAVTDQEFRNAYKTYFPAPGDDAETMRQKRERRLKQQKTFLEQGKVDLSTLESSTPAPSAQTEPNKQTSEPKSTGNATLQKYRSQGKRVFKDTVDGGYVTADTAEEAAQLLKERNPKQGNQPRYIEVK